jgi:hypothetical protein
MNDRKGLSKRSLPFFETKWGSGGRMFKSSHPDSVYNCERLQSLQ